MKTNYRPFNLIVSCVFILVTYFILTHSNSISKNRFFNSHSSNDISIILSVNVNNKDHYLAKKEGEGYTLLFVPKHHNININDPVYSTGLDTIHQSDMLIGHINSIQSLQELPYQSITISLPSNDNQE